ncbi:hypothetical protein GCK72_019345 [Caenorhabditis remanei]|uniref:Guanylate cyclase n=1 Tax=Caenorhabditis remanei TaxID=31234 RepID=A0A6A5GCG4_CAERE|nr:hypothetical protein GCK72_019345 [Caenorhabditis remanei]KAF1752790.1 hypothetical protein GCK72_019345 [Caenorhabditis remanei]
MHLKLCISLLLLVGIEVSGKNILIYNSVFGYSHVKFISLMANIIADHGHNVTLFQPYHILHNTEGLVKNKNIEIIDYLPDHYDELVNAEAETFPMFWDDPLVNHPILETIIAPKLISGAIERTATQLFKDQEVLNQLKSKKFDVVIAETFELTGVYLAYLLDVPCIPIMPAVRFTNTQDVFGQPSLLGYVQQPGSKMAPEAGFLDRLNDVYRHVLMNLNSDWNSKYQNEIFEKAIGRPIPYWKDLVKQCPIYMTNSNPYLDFAVPTTATIVHIGGITVDLKKKKNPLPDDYEKILQERESTVLISFGSVIRSFQMPENFKNGIIKMFESLPDVTFIWKYEKDDAEFQKRLPKNVHLKKWVPQPALLADRRLKAFVTHGGLGSTTEVAYSGKPALMVPIFGDQPHNADMLARHGGAIAYDKYNLKDSQKLTNAIRSLVYDTKYKSNAESLLDVLANQPIDPKVNLMKHLEFAMKFPNHRSQVPAINQNVEGGSLYINYRTSASAASIAIDRIKREGLLVGYDFKFTILFDQCDENVAAGMAVKLFRDYNIDALIGPTTNIPAIPVFNLATYYNIPVITWGMTTAAALDDVNRYPTTGILSIGSRSLAVAFRSIMLEYGWDQFVYAYSLEGDDEKCETMRDDFQDMIAYYGDIVLSYTVQIKDQSEKGMLEVLKDVSTRGRTIRQTDGSYRYPWVDSTGPQASDLEAIPGFQRSIFIVDMQGQGNVGSNYTLFEDEAATYAGQLHDSVYLYGVAMDKMLKTQPSQYRNGTAFPPYLIGTFTGVGGPVVMDDSGGRSPTLFVLTLSPNNSASLIMTIDVDQQEATIHKEYTDEATAVWYHRKGIRPLDEPVCGYTGSLCPANAFFEYIGLFITAIAVITLTILGAVLAFVFLFHAKRQEVERQNALWQIPFKSMMTVAKKGRGEHSMRSISSVPSTISSTRSSTLSEVGETRNYTFYQIQNDVELEKVAAKKYTSRIMFDSKTCANMRQMRLIDHANLNKFIGMCLDAPQLLSVWRFCSRGSLADVISKASLQMDGFFVYSLMKDIVNGLTWIHESYHEFHGMLTSKNCLLNDRWQLKITDFGLRNFRTHDQYNKADRLWTAPELLRNDDLMGSREGDIYSLGIISAELITRKSVFDLENRKEDADEIIYRLKKGGLQSPRPNLDHDESLEMNPALLHLVRDCWTERPSERPDIKQVFSQLRSMNTNRNDNLMDHVFNVLESYASTLEDEVAERMKELVEEKKKSDVLLYRMLPKQVADKLKLGQTIEPETFDVVTLFFSDVVGFTTIAGKCTPLQVVNLLNGLYTIFDGIIDQHDVYKVETIGDGYFVASGVPRRNGNEHTRNIASMSLAFVKALADFRIPHLSGEKINIRVGFHCGSVVAGVVGLTMPRYCLFGDAVNTASRMESNSKPGRVHISDEANHMLMTLGGFTTETRGETIIKGKGVMTTYWLIRMADSAAPKKPDEKID